MTRRLMRQASLLIFPSSYSWRNFVMRPLLLCGLIACGGAPGPKSLTAIVDGRWQSACLSLDGIFATHQVEYHLQDAKELERREHFFLDKDCAAAAARVTYTGSYELEVKREPYLYNINLYYDDVSAEALRAEGQQAFESEQFCKIDSWPIDQVQDITLRAEQACPSFGVIPIKNWNLVSVKRSLSLTFGADIGHENSRPDRIENSNPALIFGASDE